MTKEKRQLRKVGQALKAATLELQALEARIAELAPKHGSRAARELERAEARQDILRDRLSTLHGRIEDITCERLSNGWQRWADTLVEPGRWDITEAGAALLCQLAAV
jgi:DNA repair exonuclease SbcCD ATPase subunit